LDAVLSSNKNHMRKINSFTFITLNGFYKGTNEDTSWHKHGGEASKYSEKSSQSGNILLFGKKTYEMMYSFWPTPMAAELYPVVAKNMNEGHKIVFSNSMKEVKWKNTSILSGDIIEQIKKLKLTEGNDMTILGSGSIISQFSNAGLIDEYTIMIDPIALDKGTSFLSGIKNKLDLKLKTTSVFKDDGIVLLTYEKKK
jgi:dihydrofolate reductase